MLFFHRNRKPKPKQKLTVRRSNRTNYKEVMNCFRSSRRKNLSSPNTTITSPPPETMFPPETEAKKPKQEMLLNIPGCTVNLVEEGETVELAKGYFTVVRLYDENVSLATVIKVGDELQWPLTKDEPVVKLDRLHYLFSLPMKDSELLSYGVSFSEQFSSELEKLDSFLKEHSCFSGIPSTSPAASGDGRVLEWKDFAPRIEDYNGVLAKAIAGGTGQIIKGIFNISNAYSKQVHKGGEMIINRAAEQKNGVPVADSKSNQITKGTKKSGVNKGLKRVRKISKMTEKMSKTLLNTVGIATGSVVGPMVRSQAGKSFLAMVPGEVLLASLDAVNQVLDAAEAAEKQALSATSKAATRVVSQKFGESAGEATGDAFATAGHVAGTAWNIFKIRKAINPASSVPSAIVKNAVKKK